MSRRVQKRPVKGEFQVEGEITKSDPEQQIVFGWAYVMKKDGQQVIDKSGDFVDDVEEIAKTAYDYVLRARATDMDHTNVKGGEIVESMVFTPEKIEKMGLPDTTPLGWWIGTKLDDDAWAAYKTGKYKSFSVHGSGTRTKAASD